MKDKILELIEFKKIDSLLDGFKKTTGLATAILDLEGRVLLHSEWRKLCSDFYQKNPETANWCSDIKIELAEKLAEGEEFHFYKNGNGLVEVAIPIVINGLHYANLFSGLFFIEEPDFDLLDSERKQYGFDETKYNEALSLIPVIPLEKIKATMEFLLETILFIIELAFQKAKEMELNDSLIINKSLVNSIIDNSPALIYISDLDGKFKLTNKKFRKIFDLPKSEIIGKWRREIMPVEIAEQHRKNDLEVIASKKAIIIEEEYIERDGTHFYISQKFPLYDLQGNIHGVGGISTDITEKKRIEEALRKSKNRYKSLFENSADGILVTNEQSEILEINNKICEILDYTCEDLISLKGHEFIHPDDLANKDHAGALEKLLQGKTLITQYRLRKKDGTYIPTELSTKMIAEGQFLTIVRDISERKQAEKDLKESEELLSAIFNNHNDLQLLASIKNHDEYTIDAVNNACMKTLISLGININKEEITGKSLRQLNKIIGLNEDYYETTITKYIEVARSGKSLSFTENLEIADQVYPSIVTITPIMNESGECEYILYNSHNISEQTRANHALIESEEKFKRIFLTSPDILTISKIEDGKYIDVNENFIETTGYLRKDIIT